MRCSAPKRDPGGGGINVARVAHRLGSTVAAIYPTGGAIGKLLHRLVEREGIDSLVTPSHVETRENFTAYEETTGEQYRFVLPGSALHRAEWEAVLDKLATLPEKPKFVVASGSVPPGVPVDFFARVARLSKQLGAQCLIDTSGPALKAALTEGVTLIKPNLVELSDLDGLKARQRRSLHRCMPHSDQGRPGGNRRADPRRTGRAFGYQKPRLPHATACDRACQYCWCW